MLTRLWDSAQSFATDYPIHGYLDGTIKMLTTLEVSNSPIGITEIARSSRAKLASLKEFVKWSVFSVKT